MDLNNLLQALQYSVGKTQDEIKMAEQFLSQAKAMEGFIPNLLLISCNKEVSAPVRLAAVVNLKSVIQDNWEETPENNLFSQNDRATLRESVLDALITCVDVPRIYRQIEEIIKFIADFDFPTVWKTILPNIVNKLKTSDKYAEIFGSLLALKNLVVNYKHSLGQEREPLEVLALTVFPILEQYAKSLLSNYNEQAATAMQAILKTFHRAIENGLPKYFINDKVLDSWMTFLILIMDKSLGPELASQTDDANVIQQRAKNIFWLNKKICGKIVSHFITKFTFPKQTRRTTELSTVSQLFLQKYAIPFLESSVKILYKKKEQYVPVKVQFFAMKYIYRALNYQNLQQCLLGHLESIMFDFLIPAMYLTLEDNEDWTSNSIEFIRKEEDLHERANNLKSVAKDYFTAICAKDFYAPDGELFAVKFMKYAAHVLAHNVDPRTNLQADLRLREAILHIFGVLKDTILSDEFLRPNVEFILENFVAPECKNSVGFLRYRACWLYGVYGGLKYENGQNIEVALTSLFTCLDDSDFPVRVNAGIALNNVLRQPGAIEVLKPVLKKVLETYIILIDLIDNDGLVKALEGIIDKFENDIHPYAYELVQHLTKTFLKVHQDNHAENQDDESEDEGEQEERGVAASGYLIAVSKIIKCGLDKNMLASLEDIVAPIIQFTLSEEGMEYVEAGLALLSSYLYNTGELSERMWQFYPELNYMIAGKPQQQGQPEEPTGWGYEFLDSILPCLQNYIQKGRNVLFAAIDHNLNITYLQLLFRTIDKVYDLYYKKKNQIEAPIISVLFITLLENYPKQIDELIPGILNKVTSNLTVQDTDLRKVLTQIAAMCFWYDAGLCFGLLGTDGTEFVLQNWIKLLPDFNQDYECQRLMFGLASILRQDVTKLPSVVLNVLPGLLKEMVNLSSKTLVLREKDDDEEAEEEDDGDRKNLLQIMAGNGVDNLEEDDDDEDDEDFNYLEELDPTEKGEYKSPLEDLCEVLYLRETLSALQQNQPDAYNQLISCLDDNDKNTLSNNFNKAETQQFEFEKFKQEEDQKRQMRGILDVSRC